MKKNERSDFMAVAILTAGGIGSRMNQEIPKQFLTVKNKPIIIYTLEAFQKHPGIDAIVVSCLNGWEDILSAYARQYGITKLKWIVKGGRTGQESILNGLKELEKHYDKDTTVLIHDGNRPLVDDDILSDAIVTCEKYGSAVATVPCNEVILKIDQSNYATSFLERDELKRTQTPHAYSLEKISWAYKKAQKENISCVASCDLMITLGEKIYFSKGSSKNIKITTVDDVDTFEAFLTQKNGEMDGCIR